MKRGGGTVNLRAADLNDRTDVTAETIGPEAAVRGVAIRDRGGET